VQVIGAGRNLEEARQAAFVERNGVRAEDMTHHFSIGGDEAVVS
jgi:hypothetical protein